VLDIAFDKLKWLLKTCYAAFPNMLAATKLDNRSRRLPITKIVVHTIISIYNRLAYLAVQSLNEFW
jgi:hypothetical protein